APGVQLAREALAQPAMLGREVLSVALHETGQQLAEERLVDGCRGLQPGGVGERRVAEHRGVQARQLVHGDPRLLDRAARDLIALTRGGDVLEYEREPALLLVVGGEPAGGQRPAD